MTKNKHLVLNKPPDRELYLLLQHSGSIRYLTDFTRALINATTTIDGSHTYAPAKMSKAAAPYTALSLTKNPSRERVPLRLASDIYARVHQLQDAAPCLISMYGRTHHLLIFGVDLRQRVAHAPCRGERQRASTNYKKRRFLLEFMYGRMTHSFSASTCGKDWNKPVDN